MYNIYYANSISHFYLVNADTNNYYLGKTITQAFRKNKPLTDFYLPGYDHNNFKFLFSCNSYEEAIATYPEYFV